LADGGFQGDFHTLLTGDRTFIYNIAMLNRVIFFDLYQTLIDVNLDARKKEEDNAKAWKVLAGTIGDKYGIQIDSAKLEGAIKERGNEFYSDSRDRKVHHHNFCQHLCEVLKNEFDIIVTQEEVTTLISEYRRIGRGHIKVYTGVIEVLTQLAKEYTLATASYTQGCYTQIDLKDLDIEKFFTHFFYTSDIGFHKESPEFYKFCLQAVKKDSKDCVMIGDNYIADVLTPQKLGINAIWMKNPITMYEYSPEQSSLSIDVKNIDALPELLTSIWSK
jgi:HAD superfamily hydrolase (TIGR01549 family)